MGDAADVPVAHKIARKYTRPRRLGQKHKKQKTTKKTETAAKRYQLPRLWCLVRGAIAPHTLVKFRHTAPKTYSWRQRGG